MDPIDHKWVSVLTSNGRKTVSNIHGLMERGMYQYMRPITLPNWVGCVWLVPIPIPVPVTAAENELVNRLCCNLSNSADIQDILLCNAALMNISF